MVAIALSKGLRNVSYIQVLRRLAMADGDWEAAAEKLGQVALSAGEEVGPAAAVFAAQAAMGSQGGGGDVGERRARLEAAAAVVEASSDGLRPFGQTKVSGQTHTFCMDRSQDK